MSVHVTDGLSAYLDGALDARDLERVQAHLETCAACLREYRDTQALRGLLRRLPDPSVPRGLDERVHWRLGREAERPARRVWWGLPSLRPMRVALAGATLLLVLGAPWGWLAGNGPREAPLDTDAYLRDYLVFSSSSPLGDGVTTTLVTDTVLPEAPSR